MYKGPMHKAKGGRLEGARWGGQGRKTGGGKIETAIFKQQ